MEKIMKKGRQIARKKAEQIIYKKKNKWIWILLILNVKCKIAAGNIFSNWLKQTLVWVIILRNRNSRIETLKNVNNSETWRYCIHVSYYIASIYSFKINSGRNFESNNSFFTKLKKKSKNLSQIFNLLYF